MSQLIGIAVPLQRVPAAVSLGARDVPLVLVVLQAPGDGVVVEIVGGAGCDGAGGSAGCFGCGEGGVEAQAQG